jgi:ArsR family transcriptional regulator
MRALIGDKPVGLFVDLGTGTGRMLEIFADRYEQGVGFDLSREMLSVARANLERAGVSHAQVRHGDLFSLPLESGAADVVCLHQVLHYLTEPAAAVREAARLLKPGGRLLISDFAPHELEFLREEHAHRRLGFSDEEVNAWRRAAGLDLAAAETLSPHSRDEKKLTVKIWLLSAPDSVRKLKSRASAA